MYLEERVAILEDIIHRMIEKHPELCPHCFDEIEELREYDEEKGYVYYHYKCRFCEHEEKQVRPMEKIGAGWFSF